MWSPANTFTVFLLCPKLSIHSRAVAVTHKLLCDLAKVLKWPLFSSSNPAWLTNHLRFPPCEPPHHTAYTATRHGKAVIYKFVRDMKKIWENIASPRFKEALRAYSQDHNVSRFALINERPTKFWCFLHEAEYDGEKNQANWCQCSHHATSLVFNIFFLSWFWQQIVTHT